MSGAAAAGVIAGSPAASAAGLTRPPSGSERSVQPDADDVGARHRGPCVISSGNGLPAVTRSMEVLAEGADPVDAVVAGVTLVEDDPDDMSVGLGGLPNEDGVVQLDASVMHGPTHKAGAVGALEGIRNAAQVALLVLKRTDHILLVGHGAQRFALAHGFQIENLLTERARQAWLKWKENLSPDDDWLNDEQRDWPDDRPRRRSMGPDIPFTTGTIHCAAVDAKSDLGACTTTSGLSYKIPGRLGDSPIVGAGMYVHNDVGAAGATGRGEAVLANCGAFLAVEEMARGATPTQACLAVLKRIADRTLEKRLRRPDGRPDFGVSMYALRKDGAFGSATMYKGGFFTVHDGREARRLPCAFLFE